MPVLTFPLALLLISFFVGGSVVTWWLQERRYRREQVVLEQQMTRTLQARYEVYEGLEQSVLKLMTRFDAMESEFKQRLIEARSPRIALEQTMKLRSTNPELWDIERDHHQTRAEHLAEISRQSARITELMDALQSMEPAQIKLNTELAHTRQRYETAVANANEAETALNAKVERLEARLREVEPLESMHEAAQRDVANAKRTLQERESAHANQLRELQAQIETLTAGQARVGELEALVARREQECRSHKSQAGELAQQLEQARKEATQGVSELEAQVTEATRLAAAAESRCSALSQERDRAMQTLQDVQAKLELTRSSQAALQKQHDDAQRRLTELEHKCSNQQATIADTMVTADELKQRLAEANGAAVERVRKVEELERALESAQADFTSQLEQREDELIDARNALQIAKSDAGQFETKIQEAERRVSEVQAQWQAERAKLQTTLDTARAENMLYRAKLSAHTNHVEQAWSVLSELKPMLETLEQKLKESDEPKGALPSDAREEAPSFDLSALDDTLDG